MAPGTASGTAVRNADERAFSAILVIEAFSLAAATLYPAVTSGSGDYRLGAHVETGRTFLVEAAKFADSIGRMIRSTGAEARLSCMEIMQPCAGYPRLPRGPRNWDQ